MLRRIWSAITTFIHNLFHRNGSHTVTITATANLVSNNPDPTKPKRGDELTYSVVVDGATETITVTPTDVTVKVPGSTDNQNVTPVGGPWVFEIDDIDSIPAPAVTGAMTQPFTQQPDNPLQWVATL